MTQYLIQMSGVPGSGKSTIARGIAGDLKAIVLDHDDTKSAILSTGIENNLSGMASYEVIKVFVEQFVSQGFTVIIDSPCLYSELLDFGQTVANRYQVRYRYIECRLDDLEELNDRLENRSSKTSQAKTLNTSILVHGKPPAREARDVFVEWAEDMKRPDLDFLVIDSSEPPNVCISQALGYVRT